MTDDESIAAFVRRRFGDEAVDYLAEPLLAGIHAGDAERLSMRALFPRLLDAERQSGSVLRAFRALHVAPSPRGAFVSLAWRHRRARRRARVGASRRTPSCAERARHRARPGQRRITVRLACGRQSRRAPSSSPCPRTRPPRLLRAFDTTLAGLCDAIPYASTATVALGYRRDQIRHPLEGSGFVVPRVERCPLLAATWVTSKWPGRAPEGHALLRGFLGGGRDPHRLERSDDELIDDRRETRSPTCWRSKGIPS